MGVILILIAVLLIIAAVRNTIGDVATHLKQDVSGEFIKWVAAIVLVGLIGYIPGLQTVSRVFLALVAVVVVLRQGKGLFSQFTTQLSAPVPAAQTPAENVIPNPTIDINLAGGSGGGGVLGAITGIAKSGATIAGAL